ncbi:MAG: hypothetical protein IKI95_02165 [Clostridia bacterium]|nr:hypothetical protein [Clostridia bacterium]
MAKKKDTKPEEFGDIIQNHELVKRTLMVAAFPGLIKQTEKNGKKVFEGFLPGFEFAEVEDIADENEIVEMLQDMLDDEVEELVVFGKSLPYVDEDEVLNQKYPEHKIVYLDINVYATPEELEYYDACSHDCANCHQDCIYENCDDDECDCGCEHDHHHHCDCGCEDDDCDCDDDCDDDCDCGCHEHEHEHEHHCACGCEDEEDDCCCGEDHCDCGHNHDEHHECCGEHKHSKDHECCGKGKDKNHKCTGEGKGKGNCRKDKNKK